MTEIKPKVKKAAPKSKNNLNLIDILIIVLILSIIGTAVYAYLPTFLSRMSGKDETIEYTVVLNGVDSKTAGLFNTGDSVLFNQLEFGTVKSCTSTVVTDVTDEENPVDLYNVTIVLSADAVIKDSEILINGKRISAGIDYILTFTSFEGTFTCTNVSVGGAQ